MRPHRCHSTASVRHRIALHSEFEPWPLHQCRTVLPGLDKARNHRRPKYLKILHQIISSGTRNTSGLRPAICFRARSPRMSPQFPRFGGDVTPFPAAGAEVKRTAKGGRGFSRSDARGATIPVPVPVTNSRSGCRPETRERRQLPLARRLAARAYPYSDAGPRRLRPTRCSRRSAQPPSRY